MTPSVAPTVTGPNIEGREATIEAAKACLRAAGYDEERIGRAIRALDGREDNCSNLKNAHGGGCLRTAAHLDEHVVATRHSTRDAWRPTAVLLGGRTAIPELPVRS